MISILISITLIYPAFASPIVPLKSGSVGQLSMQLCIALQLSQPPLQIKCAIPGIIQYSTCSSKKSRI